MRGKGYIAWIEEIPGVNTQGKTKREARQNLQEALSLILEVNKELAEERVRGSVVREPLRIWIRA